LTVTVEVRQVAVSTRTLQIQQTVTPLSCAALEGSTQPATKRNNLMALSPPASDALPTQGKNIPDSIRFT